MPQNGCHPAFCSSVKKPTKNEIEVWEHILNSQGLSMDAGGLGSHRLDYGAKYFDVSESFTYTKPDVNARQKYQNKIRAEQILSLTNKGLSIRAAARELGIHFQNAALTLKRHKANFTCHPASGSNEGNRENGDM